MGDLIDREKALKEIHDRHEKAVEWFLTTNDEIKARAEAALASFTECYITILKLPSAEQWIPLKEKLPNDEQRVLLSSRGGVELVTWDEDSKRLYRDCRNLVVAWMPLPDCYEEVDE